VSSESSRQALVEEEVTRDGSSSSFEIKFCLLASLLNNQSGYFLEVFFYSKIEVSTWL
jgi:hypothetical protein